MKKEKENLLIEQTKKTSIKEACAWSVMDGFGLRYITPYALSIGANNTHIGLLNAIPSMIGNLSQLFTLKVMKKFPRKKIVFWGTFLQAFMWLLLIAAGSLFFIFNIKNQTPPYAVIIIYTILILFGAFASPAWSSWMRDIVIKDRGVYFGKRSRIAGIVSMMCLLIAGFILDYFKQTKIFLGFIIIFFIAFIGRFISSKLILKQYEPKFKQDKQYYFSFFDFVKKMCFNNFGKFTLYFSLVYFAVTISSPFFAVYMFKNLNFSYLQYMLVILSSAITSFLFLPLWGRFADEFGNLKVMRLTGIWIPIVPFLWWASILLKDSPHLLVYLITVEAITGIAWAGFNLATGNFIYDAVTRERLAICVSYFNILAGIGVLCGSLLGGLISSINFSFFGINPLFFVFILSGAVRLFVYIIMNPKIKEVRKVKKFGIKDAERKIKHLSFHKFLEYFDISAPHFHLFKARPS